MSRIGNRILEIPQGLEVGINQDEIKVKGPKGELLLQINPLIKVEINNNQIKTLRVSEEKKVKQLHGTMNSLIKSMINGVINGYKKTLEINGVGYKAILKGKILNLSLGFSHDINLEIPQDITLTVPSPTEIIVEGIDKQKVGAFAGKIKALRKTEPYKGKGIRYKGEHVIRKVGKTAGK